jgi:pSer/pThr/pTyr-binding forkhead associated (FHA) protein
MRGDSPAATHGSAAETAVQPRAATLTLTAPPSQAGRSVTIRPHGTVVGRGEDADLSVTDDRVSRRHFMVCERAGRYEVADLGSRNGTQLNGEPVTAIRPLRDGDRLSAGGVEIEFSWGMTVLPAARRSTPPSGGSWRPDEETKVSDPVPVRTAQSSLGRELHASTSFSGQGLLLAVLGSVVGTALAGAASAGPWGALAGAAVTPVVSTAFATRRAGDRGRVAGAAIVLLSVGALIITVTGVSLADLATGKSVLPGNGSQSGTFPGINVGPAPSGSHGPPPGTAHAGRVDCGAAVVESTVTCHPGAVLVFTGEGRMKITRVEVVGESAGDFVAGSECVGKTLQSGSSCETSVTFTAAAAGPRTAVLVIHQTLPAPDQGTRVDITGVGQASPLDPGTCPSGSATDAPLSPGCPQPSPAG